MVPWRDFGLERQWRVRRSGVRPSDGATILIHEAAVSDRIEQGQHLTLEQVAYVAHGEALRRVATAEGMSTSGDSQRQYDQAVRDTVRTPGCRSRPG